jgi:phosphoribosyl 1,2-cyclic phosphodiesterase
MHQDFPQVGPQDLQLPHRRVRVTFCGTRGSTPASGPEYVRYGGHTSCVALAHDGQPPSLVLDAGSGLRRVTTLLDGEAFSGSLLLGHLHLDHVQGLGFFSAADRGWVDVYVPAQDDPRAVLGRIIGPPIFPLTPDELRGNWSFHSLEPGWRSIEGWSVLALDIPHGGGRTFGYRISDGSASLAYLSDHSPLQLGEGPDGLGEYHPAALSLARGVDLLIHDAQHRAAEFPAKAFLGHSAAEYAYGLAERAGARRLALFHHDPDRTDVHIDAIVADLADGIIDVFAAAENQSVDLCSARPLTCQG